MQRRLSLTEPILRMISGTKVNLKLAIEVNDPAPPLIIPLVWWNYFYGWTKYYERNDRFTVQEWYS